MPVQKVFMSHSHDDSAFCGRIAEYVKQRLPGIDIFYSSRDVRIGEFVREIGRQIDEREVFIVVLSPKSVVSPWVGLECAQAIHRWVYDKRRTIIPVQHKPASVVALAGQLSVFHTINCVGPDEGAGFDELVEALRVDGGDGSNLTNAQRAFEELRQVVAELLVKNKRTLFPTVNRLLQERQIDFRRLGYSKFSSFIADAEGRGYIRVNWAGEHSTVTLPGEDLGDVLQPVPGEVQVEIPEAHAVAGEPISAELLLTYIDFLERSLPFINAKGIHTYARRRVPDVAVHSIDALLESWKQDGTLEEYETEPMCTNSTGSKMQVAALRLNRESEYVQQSLAGAYEQRPDNWRILPIVKRIVFLTTIVVLADELSYFHWHLVRMRLTGGEDATDWDTVFVTAVDAGVIQVELVTIPHEKTGTDYTLKRIVLNRDHPDVQSLL